MRKLLLWIGIWACVQAAVTSCQPKRTNAEWIRLADEQVYKDVDSIKTLLAKVHTSSCNKRTSICSTTDRHSTCTCGNIE